MIRVLIADDSATVREYLSKILNSDSEMEVVGTAENGQVALEMTRKLRPDIVTMDVNMPVMGGFEATKQIMTEVPTPIVIVSASVDPREVGISMAALNAGALTIIGKPAGLGSPDFEESVRQFSRTVKAMSGVKVVRHRESAPPPERLAARGGASAAERFRVVAMAASTGGPAVLGRIFSSLPIDFPLPILVVQHMAHGFMDGMASWLAGLSPLRVKLAEDGEMIAPATAYLARDDLHMGVGRDHRIRLERGPPVGGFRPSADHLFNSVAAAYGEAALAVILTGMGHDGVEGLRALHGAGGKVIAQDEASSVVFGMPKAALDAGLAQLAMSPASIGDYLIRAVARQGAGKGGRD